MRHQHFAIYAGLKKATGRFIIVLDGDLEDPPEEIPRLLARAKEDADIVVATYSDRAHPDWRRIGSRLYFWILGAGAPDGGRLSMFTALSERGRSAYLAAPLAGRVYLLVLLGLDLPTAFVSSYKEPRLGDGSSYSFGKLSPLAARNLLLFNPRRFAFVLTTLAAIILLAAVSLWGAWPAVRIWLACSLAVGSSLAAWRLRMIQAWASRRECETEMLHG